MEILNQKKCHEQSTHDGSDAFKGIDPSNGGDIFLASGRSHGFDILGIEFTPVSEKTTLRKGNREEYQE
jgi:hypothetical protein